MSGELGVYHGKIHKLTLFLCLYCFLFLNVKKKAFTSSFKVDSIDQTPLMFQCCPLVYHPTAPCWSFQYEVPLSSCTELVTRVARRLCSLVPSKSTASLVINGWIVKLIWKISWLIWKKISENLCPLSSQSLFTACSVMMIHWNNCN